MKALKNVYGKSAPQSEPIVGRETGMVRNSAGGYVFPVTDWTRLERFLVLGTEGGTYYVDEHKMTLDNAKVVRRCLDADGLRTVQTIVDISDRGRAPKNDPALFTLAMALSFGNLETKKAAEVNLPRVARIGTHILHLVSFLDDMRGWGRLAKRAVGNWYIGQETDSLTYNLMKYRQRDGWSHRDVLRLTHPTVKDKSRNGLFRWATNPKTELDNQRIHAFTRLQNSGSAKESACLIKEHPLLSREMVPTEHLGERVVWEALLPNLPMTALIRNLATLTRHGILKPLAGETEAVANRLTNAALLHKARVHPLALLVALRTYARGKSDRGSTEWTPVPEILEALEKAYMLAFDNLEPIGERVYLAIDVSGSMGAPVGGLSNLTAREAAAAMAMVIARSASRKVIKGFTRQSGVYWGGGGTTLDPLPIIASTTLREAINVTSNLPFGITDCALPMLDAMTNGIEADAFIVLTDNETWAGDAHPSEALRKYRQKTGIPAKMVVVAMTSTGFSIADPEDAGMLDVVGFDTAVPKVIGDFIKSQ